MIPRYPASPWDRAKPHIIFHHGEWIMCSQFKRTEHPEAGMVLKQWHEMRKAKTVKGLKPTWWQRLWGHP